MTDVSKYVRHRVQALSPRLDVFQLGFVNVFFSSLCLKVFYLRWSQKWPYNYRRKGRLFCVNSTNRRGGRGRETFDVWLRNGRPNWSGPQDPRPHFCLSDGVNNKKSLVKNKETEIYSVRKRLQVLLFYRGPTTRPVTRVQGKKTKYDLLEVLKDQ